MMKEWVQRVKHEGKIVLNNEEKEQSGKGFRLR